MKRPAPGLWIGLASTALVVWLVVLDLDKTSPGPLAPVHERVAELQGVGACEQCHDTRGRGLHCAACHAPIHDELSTGSGLHGRLEPGLARDCGACHIEHLSGDPPLVGDFAFDKAGYQTSAEYDHAGFQVDMSGKHARIECSACHEEAEVALLEAGHSRYCGLSSDCSSCHEDPHEGLLTDCLSCHAPTGAFVELAGFEHDARWPLIGAHADLACLDCHAEQGEFSIEQDRALPPDVARGCADCHEHPHRAKFLMALTALALPAREVAAGECTPCHSEADPSFHELTSEAGQRGAEVWHAASGFELRAPHAELSCRACHESQEAGDELAALVFDARVPARPAAECAACHEDPHEGQFAKSSPSGGSDCRECHLETAFEPHQFDVARHARSFPLELSHAAVACDRCHTETSAAGARRFVPTPSDCVDCHEDVHGWNPRSAAALASVSRCEQCHLPNVFEEVDLASFEHDAWTSFELEGAHGEARCESCHVRSAQVDERGRHFGRVEAHDGLLVGDCENCHVDVHRGHFDALPELFATPAGSRARDCTLCHDTTDFAQATAFDHDRQTSFALAGAHARADCQRCHAPAALPDAGGRRFGWIEEVFGAPADACATCHQDAHDGLFDRRGRPEQVEGRATCARCHDSESFEHLLGAPALTQAGGRPGLDARFAPFEHALWTDFELGGAHAQLGCTACHAPPPTAAADSANAPTRMARAAGARCASCHQDPHAGQFASSGATDCQSCHPAQASSFHELDFDHDEDSVFPLDEQHDELACAACHRPSKLRSGLELVRYKPLGTKCADCHRDGTPAPRSTEGNR